MEYIPYEISIINIERFLDFKNVHTVRWIEPVFIAPLKAYLEDGGMSGYPNSNSYIFNMINMPYQEGKTYSPIENFRSRGDIERLSNHLATIMLKQFYFLSREDQKDLKDYLRYLFTEIMNNVIDHSKSSIGGFVMAQYYPKQHRIQFVVADRGQGFLRNVQLKRPEIDSEEEAILIAMEKGFTATNTSMYGHERNAGFGLHAMRRILDETGGSFVIISNNGLVRYHDGNLIHKKIDPSYHGTIVAFNFYENNINLSFQDFAQTRLWVTFEEDEEDWLY